MIKFTIHGIFFTLLTTSILLSCSNGKSTFEKEGIAEVETEIIESEQQEIESPEKNLIPNKSSQIPMDSSEKIEEGLSKKLKSLSPEESIEILVYPSKGAQELEEVLVRYEKEDILSFRYLKLAECFWVKTIKEGVNSLAQNEEVQVLRENSAFGTN